MTDEKITEVVTFLDEEADERNDNLIKKINKLIFWLRIIGIYFLGKIIIGLVLLITKGAIIYQIIDMVELLLF